MRAAKSDPSLADIASDFSINTGPDGTAWLIDSHNGINVYKLDAARTGVLSRTSLNIGTTIRGGIGLAYNKGWWYLTGSGPCPNCVSSKTYYLMARNPEGPWISPIDGASALPLKYGVLSQDTGNGQVHGSVMLPDANGGTHMMFLLSHYVSSPTAAPGLDPEQPGDNSLALAGQWWYPATFDKQGRIDPMQIRPRYAFPLARRVRSAVPPAYQADMSVSRDHAITQSWTVPSGTKIGSILLSVFQRTVDLSRFSLTQFSATPTQDPLVNASLDVSLSLPDGSVYNWTVDPRQIAWQPRFVPLNLPSTFAGGGTVTLTLSTTATNGSYGVAVGAATLPAGRYAHIGKGSSSSFPEAGMLLRTLPTPARAPVITGQPRSVTAKAGSTVGFLVQATGDGLGYTWTKHGAEVRSPAGLTDATAPNLRLVNVTAADAGLYQVVVSNPIGAVSSEAVRLVVTP